MLLKETDSLIECVPNFSEGQNPEIISAIANSIKRVDGVKLLHIDSGMDVNRTVVTFAGNPDAVVEAAFQSIKTASELIDMQSQKGIHPRFGATDVCPLVPIRKISMKEVIALSVTLAKRVGEELKIPVYLYENSATALQRKNLSYLRKGNYEGIHSKIKLPEWRPDFGPANFNPKSGNIAIGARPFLIACNVNLKSKDLSIANSIAREIRTTGYVLKNNKSPENWKKIPGKCKALKAIGWYIHEYNCVQVSMNITDYKKTGLHDAYEAVKEAAQNRNTVINGMEIIGLVPKEAILSAGKYYAKFESTNKTSEEALINLAVNRLGLNTQREFKPRERILEYILN